MSIKHYISTKVKSYLLVALIFFMVNQCVGEQVTLHWDCPVQYYSGDRLINIPTNWIQGIVLYYDTQSRFPSNLYQNIIHVGYTNSYTITNLNKNINYYFAVKSYILLETNFMSSYSDELVWNSEHNTANLFFPRMFNGYEYILETNKFDLYWPEISNATSYKVISEWIDPTQTFYYNNGVTTNHGMIINRTRIGHFTYKVQALSNSTIINIFHSTNLNSQLKTNFTTNSPWRVYWKLPAPGGIIIE